MTKLYYHIKMEEKDYLLEEFEEDLSEEEVEEKVENNLIKLVRQTIEYYETHIYPEAYEIVKAKILFSWDLRALLCAAWNDHRSCNVYPLISSIHDTYTSNTYDFVPEMRVVARNPQDIEKAEMWQDFIDWAWNAWNALYANEQMLSEAVLLWVSSWQASFLEENKDIEYYRAETKTTETIKEDNARPSLEHVPFFEMYIDPASSDLYNARWKFRRKIISWSKVCSSYGSFINLEDDKEEILDSSNYASTCDYNKIWEINKDSRVYIDSIIKSLSWTDWTGFSIDSIVYKNMFQVKYENDMVEVIEYWEWDKLIIMINWIVVYDWATIYPVKWDPFVHIYMEKFPWSVKCFGVWHKLMSHQKQMNSHWNAIQDAINIHMRPMYIVENLSLVWHDWTTPKKITWKDWETLVSKAPWIQNWWIRILEFIDPTMIQISRDLIRQLLLESQEIIWLNSYTQWGQWKVERSPTAVRARTQIMSSRLQPLVHSVNRMHQKVFEMWLAMASLYKWDEFNVRVINKNNWEIKYNIVTPYEILNKFDVVVENENDRIATKQERLWQTVQLLQVLTPYILDQQTWVYKIDIDDMIIQLLNSLDFKWLKKADIENMKNQIKEKFELATYQQELAWQLQGQWQVQWGDSEPDLSSIAWAQQWTVPPKRLEWEPIDEYVTRWGLADMEYTMWDM